MTNDNLIPHQVHGSLFFIDTTQTPPQLRINTDHDFYSTLEEAWEQYREKIDLANVLIDEANNAAMCAAEEANNVLREAKDPALLVHEAWRKINSRLSDYVQHPTSESKYNLLHKAKLEPTTSNITALTKSLETLQSRGWIGNTFIEQPDDFDQNCEPFEEIYEPKLDHLFPITVDLALPPKPQDPDHEQQHQALRDLVTTFNTDFLQLLNHEPGDTTE